METIKVNMSPNPLDVQTIHASQNDGEAREWEFELHNNGDVIDASEISDQLVFKAYKGGTEQLLPENGSTPTTSPFKGDIRYPQGLLSDQEFTYRESPTEEDGLAKVNSIKGNTLVWNQLVQNGNFADTSYWSPVGTTITASNNELTIKLNADGGSRGIREGISIKANHTYFVHYFEKPNRQVTSRCFFYANGDYFSPDRDKILTANVFNEVIHKITADRDYGYFYIQPASRSSSPTTTDTFVLKNVNIVDLTAMGLDSLTVEEFTSLFPLSYYSYNQGSLLSFNGNGIKTVGKNLASGISQGAVDIHGGTTSNEKRLRVDGFVRVFQGDHYTFTATSNSGKTLQIYTRYFADANGSEQVSYLDWLNLPRSVIIPSGVNYATFTIRFGNNDNITLNDISDVQVEHGTSATSYEPYTSSTLSLPISTYFPNGMKSAGNVYDELTPKKAITRIGVVDLGTLEWSYDSSVPRFVSTSISSLAKLPVNATTKANLTTVYQTESFSLAYTGTVDKCIALSISGAITLVDKSYTDAQTFKTAMSGVYLYYELATPTETSFTTASLVTENTEIPLSNEDGVLIGKCTEQLSENPGFIDAKIKLADADGECYSNKIQLHVERSPQ